MRLPIPVYTVTAHVRVYEQQEVLMTLGSPSDFLGDASGPPAKKRRVISAHVQAANCSVGCPTRLKELITGALATAKAIQPDSASGWRSYSHQVGACIDNFFNLEDVILVTMYSTSKSRCVPNHISISVNPIQTERRCRLQIGMASRSYEFLFSTLYHTAL